MSPSPVAALSALLILSVLTLCTAKIRWTVDEDSSRHNTFYTIEVKRNPSLSFDHHRSEEHRDRPTRIKKAQDCCGLGYRSQWLSWEHGRRVINYCSESLPCCPNLVSKEIEMWGGFGFKLCIQGKQKKEMVKINPFTRYLSYYETEEDE